MKVAVIHPLRHHAFYSMEGVLQSGAQVVGLFGYFNRGDWLDRLLARTRYAALSEGWQYAPIAPYVKTSVRLKLLFLLWKKWPQRFWLAYFGGFQTWAIRQLKKEPVDCIHVLDDYCQQVIDYALAHGIRVVYEQIIVLEPERYIDPQAACDEEQRRRRYANLQNAAAVLMASDFVKDSLRVCLTPQQLAQKAFVVPYGADLAAFPYRPRQYRAGETLHLVTVARLERRKGIDRLLAAMRLLAGQPVELALVGPADGPEGEALRRQAAPLKNVHYVGTVPHEQMAGTYARCHVFVLPSLAEGSSLAVYEAMACGLPCIVTANCGSVVQDGCDGFVVPAGSAEALAGAVERFLAEPQLVQAMGARAGQNVRRYTWPAFEQGVARVYREEIERRA